MKDSWQEKEQHLTQAERDADNMADLAWLNEQHVSAYKEKLREKDEQIKALEQQLHTLQNPSEPSATINHEAKNHTQQHIQTFRHSSVSTIKDFLAIAELNTVKKVTYHAGEAGRIQIV